MLNETRLVHIVDDDEGVRRSLDFLLSHAGYSVRRWDTAEAFLRNADKMAKACAIIDIRMPGMDGLALQREMKTQGFDFPVVVLSGHGDIAMAVQAMREGAVDFLQKPADRQHVLDAVRDAYATIDDCERQRGRFEWARTMLGRLTLREQEVLDGLACGYPNKTIAYDLGISSRTVEVYRANIMDKLRVTSFAEALRIAFAAGLGSESKWLETHTLIHPSPAAD
jgi:two-component system response regulator FixJ